MDTGGGNIADPLLLKYARLVEYSRRGPTRRWFCLLVFEVEGELLKRGVAVNDKVFTSVHKQIEYFIDFNLGHIYDADANLVTSFTESYVINGRTYRPVRVNPVQLGVVNNEQQ